MTGSNSTPEQAPSLAEVLQQHSSAKAAYLERKAHLKTLHGYLEKHRGTATTARNESDQLGKEWRSSLRESNGELTKEIQKARASAASALELADEFDLLCGEVGIDFELCRLDVYELRSSYRSHQQAAARLYALESRNHLFSALSATDQWKAFARELSRAGLLSGGETHSKLEAELLRLINTEELEAGAEGFADVSWPELELEPRCDIEALPKELELSHMARQKMRQSLQARQQAA